MNWYLIHTKPRSEIIALKNLSNQGYECYLPMLNAEKFLKGTIEVKQVPLFPRYLFIKLDLDFSARGWGSIRSTRGVSELVKFGSMPARVSDDLIQLMIAREIEDESKIKNLYKLDQSVEIVSGPFLGFESIYRGMNPQKRVMVLIDLMGKSLELKLDVGQIRLLN